MDRQIVYAGSIPLDTDLLNVQRNVMTALGVLARAVIGDGGLVDGMECVPGSGGYSVVVGRGSYSALMPLDGRAFGALPADYTPVMQTALHVGDTVLQLGPPPDGSSVVCWLVQILLAESDAGQVALPYWNAANPSIPFTGPGNSGVAQATQRQLRVAISVKPSAPEPFPNGTPPAADPGWLGLYAVTTFANKPAIDPTDIVQIWSAPTLRFGLPALPPAPTAQAVFNQDTMWQAPPRVRQIRVRLVGGGGGGGGGHTSFSGGGGGSGGFAEAIVPVRAGQAYSVVVGAGGAPGSSGTTGQSGGESRFGDVVRATGGQGGGSHNPDSHGGSPGVGIAGGFLQGGGFGGDGANVPNVPGGNGGASAFGGGGRGADEGGAPANGNAGGSGGGGGYGLFSGGGNGANGVVVIDF